MAGLISFTPFILILIIMYVLLIRPQQQALKRQRAKIDAVKKGDEVVTGGGHIGKVTKVNEHEVEVEFSSGQRHRVVKSMLSDVRATGAKAAND
ncbi:MAG TPA: preprotein translocase subunit YajC [Allosphingosinicella sp.]